MPSRAEPLRRRTLLAAALGPALLAPLRAPAAAARPRGLVLPREGAPALPLTGADGRAASLDALLRDRVTAVQLMFTGCASSCPVQGAAFAAAIARVRAPDVRWLSITVDPLRDGPVQLRAWLARFGAVPGWTAAAPRLADVDRLAAFLYGAPALPERHTAQAFLFDRAARLAFRTVDQPSPEHLAELLGQLAVA